MQKRSGRKGEFYGCSMFFKTGCNGFRPVHNAETQEEIKTAKDKLTLAATKYIFDINYEKSYFDNACNEAKNFGANEKYIEDLTKIIEYDKNKPTKKVEDNELSYNKDEDGEFHSPQFISANSINILPELIKIKKHEIEREKCKIERIRLSKNII